MSEVQHRQQEQRAKPDKMFQMTPARKPKQGKYMDLVLILIGFDRFSIRMDEKIVRIDGTGHANTTYISEFHPHIQKP